MLNVFRAYHENSFQVEVGLLEVLGLKIQVLCQLEGVLNGHAATLPQVGLHCMGAVPQQNNIALGPLEDWRAIKDITP